MSVTPFDLLLLILASFRLTHALVFDRIAEPLRKQFPGHGWLAYLIRCYWCSGVWMSALALLLFSGHRLGRWVVILFAVAGGQAALETLVSRWADHDPSIQPTEEGKKGAKPEKNG